MTIIRLSIAPVVPSAHRWNNFPLTVCGKNLEDIVTPETQGKHLVLVIGAGPAGIYAARQLALAGVHVVLLNRDIKPGGLAEYGIYYEKVKMKEGLRKQFHQILEMPEIDYIGNVIVGKDSGLSLDELRQMGFQAVLVSVGAQGTKWLGLPGENLRGVYHAKDIVYHYNSLPPFSTKEFSIGKRVAMVGVGNVMMDIAHWVIRDLKVEEALAVARRGPAEVKFTKKEMEGIIRNLDIEDLDAEMLRVAPVMQNVGQDVQAAREYILSALPKAEETNSPTRFLFDFLASPTRIMGDEHDNVCGLEVEDTNLVRTNGDTKAKGLGSRRILDVDTVIFCIGDRVDDGFGLPIQWNEFVKNPTPRFPVGDTSYEAFDPQSNTPIEGVFVAGWSREASSGLVGIARKDGENGGRAVLQYLESLPPQADYTLVLQQLNERLAALGRPLVNKDQARRLQEIENAEAERLGVDDFKMKTNQEMLVALGLG
jgi:ferredoxin--NADP+ reductase